jgi:hypothetical protein
VEVWIRAIVIILGSVLGSGGFWKFLEVRSHKNNANSRLMMGIAYDKITTLGLHYIERGWITKDELEEFQKYFVSPYLELGGNGVAERIWNDVRTLPFQTHAQHEEIFRNERYVPNVPVVTGIRNHQDTAA